MQLYLTKNSPITVFLSTKTPKKIRQTFDLEFKAEVVSWYEENGKNQTFSRISHYK